VIGRVWSGRAATSANADTYVNVFTEEVLAGLHGLAGFRGAYLLRRESGGGVEFVTLTLFDGMAAVPGFAGDDPDAANVSASARAVLSDVDERVRHFTVVASPQ
jgi:heme-degrading monooxygenase HmoA